MDKFPRRRMFGAYKHHLYKDGNFDYLLNHEIQTQEKYEHEHFVNMVVNYGLTVTTETETLQNARWFPQGRSGQDIYYTDESLGWVPTGCGSGFC